MPSISGNLYVSQYNNSAANLTPTYGRDSQLSTSQIYSEKTQENAALRVTLSDAAKASLAERNSKPLSEVERDARENLSKILTEVKRETPLHEGKLVVDLSHIDRRELFAVVSNSGKNFSADEQKSAAIELLNRFDDALAGPASVVRFTGDFKALYNAARDHLEKAGAEERTTLVWQKHRLAIGEVFKQMVRHPDKDLQYVKNDPAAEYLKRLSDGGVAKKRDFSSVANEARLILDKLQALAKADGKDLVFDEGRKGVLADLARFTGRSLAAIALNRENTFTKTEMYAAKTEMNIRVRASMQAAINQSNVSSDPTSLSKGLMAHYASLSSEEREAAGLTPGFHQTLVSNYESSQKILQAMSGLSSAGQGLSLIDFI